MKLTCTVSNSVEHWLPLCALVPPFGYPPWPIPLWRSVGSFRIPLAKSPPLPPWVDTAGGVWGCDATRALTGHLLWQFIHPGFSCSPHGMQRRSGVLPAWGEWRNGILNMYNIAGQFGVLWAIAAAHNCPVHLDVVSITGTRWHHWLLPGGKSAATWLRLWHTRRGLPLGCGCCRLRLYPTLQRWCASWSSPPPLLGGAAGWVGATGTLTSAVGITPHLSGVLTWPVKHKKWKICKKNRPKFVHKLIIYETVMKVKWNHSILPYT